MEYLIAGFGNYILSPSDIEKKFIPIPGTIMKGIVPEVNFKLLLLYLLSFIVDSNSFNSCKV